MTDLSQFLQTQRASMQTLVEQNARAANMDQFDFEVSVKVRPKITDEVWAQLFRLNLRQSEKGMLELFRSKPGYTADITELNKFMAPLELKWCSYAYGSLNGAMRNHKIPVQIQAVPFGSRNAKQYRLIGTEIS